MSVFKTLVTLMVTAAMVLTPVAAAFANPVGGSVAAGDVSFSGSGDVSVITQSSQNAIINWQDFSIGAGQMVQFLQPGANAAVLNRVVSSMPSTLLGQLSATGKVFLINPNGVVIGSGAQINAAGFVASTLNVSDADFMDGGDLNFAGDSSAVIQNMGSISVTGGDVFLFARHVENKGSISAVDGTAGLVAGSDVLLHEAGDERVLVRPSGGFSGDIGVNNEGSIEAATAHLEAAGGNVYALAIKQTGVIRAAQALTHKGGTVKVLAKDGNIYVDGTIDASGETGGGTVLIGGDYQGSNPDIANAHAVYVAESAQIKADATSYNDGGKIIVWADDSTQFYGSLSARGAMNGGFAEVSGHNYLDFNGAVDMSATQGHVGTLLLDPLSITISTGNNTNVSGTTPFQPTGANSILKVSTLQSALANADVIVQTTGTASDGLGAGDITVLNAITWNSSRSLTLKAHNDININANITGNGTRELSSAGVDGVNRFTVDGVTDTYKISMIADSDNNGGGNINVSPTLGMDVIVKTNDGGIYMKGNSVNLAANGLNYAAQVIAAGTNGKIALSAHDLNLIGSAGLNKNVVMQSSQQMMINLDRDLLIQGGTESGTTSYLRSMQVAEDSIKIKARHIDLVAGNATNSRAYVQSAGGAQVDISGDLSLQGGEASGAYAAFALAQKSRFDIDGDLFLMAHQGGAYIQNSSTAADGLTISAKNMVLQAGTVDSYIQSGGLILHAAEDISLVAGVGGKAYLRSLYVGNNSLVLEARDLTLTGGDGANSRAYIQSAGGFDIDVHGDLLMQGGAGSSAYTSLTSGGAFDSFLSVGGDMTLQGGSGSSSSSSITLSSKGIIDVDGDLLMTSNGGSAYIQGNSTAADALSIFADDVSLQASAVNSYIQSSGGLSIIADGDVSLTAGQGGSAYLRSQFAGAHSLVLQADDLTLTSSNAANSRTYVQSSGGFDIALDGDLLMQGGAGNSAYAAMTSGAYDSSLIVDGDMTLRAGSATGSTAYVTFAGKGSINVGGELSVIASTLSAYVQSSSTAADALNVIARKISVKGGTPHAYIQSSGGLAVHAAEDISLTAGSGGTAYLKSGYIGADSLVLTARHLTLTGGDATNSRAYVQSAGGLDIDLSGNLSLQGGTGSSSYAMLTSGGSFDSVLDIDGNMNLQSGSGSGSSAYVNFAGKGLVDVDGDLSMIAGGGMAYIQGNNTGADSLFVTADDITLVGGAANNARAYIQSSGGMVVASGGDLSLIGGSVANTQSYFQSALDLLVTADEDISLLTGMGGTATQSSYFRTTATGATITVVADGAGHAYNEGHGLMLDSNSTIATKNNAYAVRIFTANAAHNLINGKINNKALSAAQVIADTAYENGLNGSMGTGLPYTIFYKAMAPVVVPPAPPAPPAPTVIEPSPSPSSLPWYLYESDSRRVFYKYISQLPGVDKTVDAYNIPMVEINGD